MRLNLKTISLAAPVVLCISCASTPEDRSDLAEVPVPEVWQASEDPTPVEDAWIRSWHSPELSLLSMKALAHNRELEAAYRRLEAALALASINGAAGIPTLGAGASAARQKTNTGDAPLTFTDNRFSVGLTLDWEVDLWGRLRDQRSAALADAQAAQSQFEGARLSLLSSTARLYFDLIEAEAQLRLASATAETFTRNAQRLRSLYEKGIAEALDTRLLEAQAAATVAAIYQRDVNRNDLARRLEVLIGEYPAALIEVPERYPALPDAVPAGLPSDLLRRRPDIQAAERALAAAEQRFSAAEKRRLPSFSLTASGGTASEDLENVIDPNFVVWSLLGNLTAPVFDAGRIAGEVDQAQARYAEALSLYENAILNAFREVEQALANEAILRRRFASLQRAADQSDRAETIAWQQYERGLTDIVTVLESQRRAFEARSASIAAENALHQNRIALLLALGGQPL